MVSIVSEENRQNKEEGSLSLSRRFLQFFEDLLFGFRIWSFTHDTYYRFISVKFASQTNFGQNVMLE